MGKKYQRGGDPEKSLQDGMFAGLYMFGVLIVIFSILTPILNKYNYDIVNSALVICYGVFLFCFCILFITFLNKISSSSDVGLLSYVINFLLAVCGVVIIIVGILNRHYNKWATITTTLISIIVLVYIYLMRNNIIRDNRNEEVYYFKDMDWFYNMTNLNSIFTVCAIIFLMFWFFDQTYTVTTGGGSGSDDNTPHGSYK